MGVGAAQQKSWGSIHVGPLAQQLIDEAGDEVSRARLLAAATKVSGAWLHALPIAFLGLQLDDDSLGIGVGLRLRLRPPSHFKKGGHCSPTF